MAHDLACYLQTRAAGLRRRTRQELKGRKAYCLAVRLSCLSKPQEFQLWKLVPEDSLQESKP